MNRNSELLVQIEGYVPEYDASSDLILPPATGESQVTNRFDVSYRFERVGIEPVGGNTYALSSNELVVDALTLAIQKNAQLVNDTIPSGYSPGDTIEFALNAQVSDYKRLDNVEIVDGITTAAGLNSDADILGDGLSFLTSFTPTYSVTIGGVTAAGTFAPANFSVTEDPSGQILGSSRITFDLSQQLIDDGQFGGDGILTGAHLLGAVGAGGTTATIRYRASMDESFDSPASGDASIDIGDILTNRVDIVADDLVDSIVVGDESAATVTIRPLSLIHQIGRIVTVEGEIINTPSSTPNVSPGDVVTFSVKVSLPTGDVEDFVIEDFVPYSMFDINDVNGDGVSGDVPVFDVTPAAYPSVGVVAFGPDDEYTGNYQSYGNPAFSYSVANNSFSLDYGSIDSPSSQDANGDGIYDFELRFTLVAGSDSLPDGFELTSLARAVHNSTNGGSGDVRAYAGLFFSKAVPVITKGIVDCTSSDAPIIPAATGLYDDAGSDGNCIGARAGDLLRFAITVQNTGSDALSRLVIQDVLPDGLDASAARILSVNRADGRALSMDTTVDGIANTADELALFGAGIALDTTVAGNYLEAGDSGAGAPYGAESLVLILEVPVVDDVAPGKVLLNDSVASVWYADSIPNSGLFEQVSDVASVTTKTIEISKDLTFGLFGDESSTESVDKNGSTVMTATIGEVMTYDITVSVPQGAVSNASLSDLLPASLTATQVNGAYATVISIDSDLSVTNLVVGDTDASTEAITVSGNSIDFDFGTITRDVDGSPELKEFVVRIYAYVNTAQGNTRGSTISNSATMSWDGGSASDFAIFTVIRPNLNISKSMSAVVANDLQAGSAVRVSMSVSNPGEAYQTSAAHDFTVEDLVDGDYFDLATIREDVTPDGYVFSTETVGDDVRVVYSSIDLERNGSETFSFLVDLKSTISLPVNLENLAIATGTSLPGDPPSTVESEETDSDEDVLRTNVPLISKSLVSTSEAHTGGSPEEVTIGERVVFRLRVDVPDGQFSDLRVTDRVPAGFDFVGSNADAGMAFPGSGYQFGGPMAGTMQSVFIGVTDNDSTPSSSASTDGDGENVMFRFGAFTNFPDGDESNDYYTIDLEMVVVDASSVVGYGPSASRLRNRGVVYVSGMSSNESRSNRVTVNVVEPNLTLEKTILEATGDGGDTFTVQLTVENTGLSNAYDIVIEDPIPGIRFETQQIGLGLPNPEGWTLQLDSQPSDGDSDTSVVIQSAPGTFLEPGGSAVFSFTIVADLDIIAPATIQNIATVESYSTLDGSLERPTGIVGRDSGGVSAEDTINISNASLQLSYVGSSEDYTDDTGLLPVLTFGERAILRVDVDLPDGTFSNGTLRFELPAGLDFVGANGASELSYAGAGHSNFGGSAAGKVSSAFIGVLDPDASADSSETLDGSGMDVSFQFNPILNSADDDGTNDDFYFFIEVVCVDESGLVGHGSDPDTLSVTARMDGGDGIIGIPTAPVTVQVAEPILSINKTMSALSADSPDQTTVTIVVANDGDSPAHELVVRDVLDATQFDVSSASLVSAPEGSTFSSAGGVVAFTYDSAAVNTGESVVFKFALNVLPEAGPVISNTATVAEGSSLDHTIPQPNGIGERDINPVSDEAVLNVPQITATKKGMDLDYNGVPLEPAERIGYTIVVSNGGAADASVVTLEDTIPLYTSYVPNSLLIRGESASTTLPDMVLDLGTIAAAESVIVYFEVEVDGVLPPEARKIVNQAKVTYAERTTIEIADNDPEGHDPVTDDGIDHPVDSGVLTSDDDPTTLYLLQGAASARSYLAFEDLKNRGWSDWDHNDTLLDVTTYYMLDGDSNVEAVSVSYQILARGAAYDAQIFLSMPILGNATWKTTYYESDHSIISSTSGSDYDGLTADVFASTREAMPPNANTRYSWGPSRTERLDATQPGKRAVVQISLDEPALNPYSSFSVSPHDTWSHIINTGEDIHRAEYKAGNTQYVWEGPLAGRSLPFVVEFAEGFDWPAEFQPIWTTHPEYVDYVKSDKQENLDWWRSFDPDLIWIDAEGANPGVGTPLSSTQNAQVMADGLAYDLELFRFLTVGPSSNWPKQLGGLLKGAPTVRDLDGDGDCEILYGSSDGKVYVMDHLGQELSGWPQSSKADLQGRYGFVVSPSVGDIDGDGALEIVCGTLAGHLYAWELDGSVISGFPQYVGRSAKSVCAVVDIDDADDAAEIIVHGGKSELWAMKGNGTALSGYPLELGGDEDEFDSWIFASSPIVLDLELDGSLQIAVGSTSGEVYVFNTDGSVVDGWPVATGDWVYSTVTPVDLDGDYEPEIVVASADGKVHAWNAAGEVVAGFPVTLDAPVYGSVAAADMTGDGANELVVASSSGAVYMINKDGNFMSGWPTSPSATTFASPIIIDVNNDGALDVVLGAQNSALQAWSRNGELILSQVHEAGDWIDGTAVASDIDKDGLVELVFGAYDGKVYVIDLDTPATDANLAWPAFRGDRVRGADAVSTDSDQDELPDAFEMAQFNGLEQSGADDFDLDGVSNANEWIAGTNAASASDFFSVQLSYLPGEPSASRRVRLTWNGVAGRCYTSWQCGKLDEGEEWELADPESGTIDCESTGEMSHEFDVSADDCFFRISVTR